jgi:NAD(P)H-hydrate epimerase
VLVLGASPGKTGAAALAALAALRTGAGLVTLATAASLNPIAAASALETMTAPLPEEAPGVLGPSSRAAILELAAGKSVLALGPGLGRSAATVALVRGLLGAVALPLVIDADGLNALAGRLDDLRSLPAAAVLTPHPGEMARLTGASTAEIQQDRIGWARRLAGEYHVHVVLKGARTIVAHPDGTACINPTGNPGMAAGGMGDVLTGVIAGLIAQGLTAEAAARAGVYLHGAAADRLAAASGPRGYLAGEVLGALPATIAERLRAAEA